MHTRPSAENLRRVTQNSGTDDFTGLSFVPDRKSTPKAEVRSFGDVIHPVGFKTPREQLFTRAAVLIFQNPHSGDENEATKARRSRYDGTYHITNFLKPFQSRF